MKYDIVKKIRVLHNTVAIRAINVRREELVNYLRKNLLSRVWKKENKLLAFASKTAETTLYLER